MSGEKQIEEQVKGAVKSAKSKKSEGVGADFEAYRGKMSTLSVVPMSNRVEEMLLEQQELSDRPFPSMDTMNRRQLDRDNLHSFTQ